MFGFKLIYGKLGETLLKVLEAAESRVENAADVALDLDKARDELSKLRIEKAELDSAFKRREAELSEKLERRERELTDKFQRRDSEVEHMLGLERKRQEFEMQSARREAVLTVREENLKADRDRFDAQMEFHDRRFTEEVGYLKEMIGTLAERLPTAHSERVTLKEEK